MRRPGRVGGYAADAAAGAPVIACRKIIRRDIEAVNNHRVGGEAANPTVVEAVY